MIGEFKKRSLPQTLPQYIRFKNISLCSRVPVEFEELIDLYRRYAFTHFIRIKKHMKNAYVSFNAIQIPISKMELFEKEILEPFKYCSQYALWLKINSEHGLFKMYT